MPIACVCRRLRASIVTLPSPSPRSSDTPHSFSGAPTSDCNERSSRSPMVRAAPEPSAQRARVGFAAAFQPPLPLPAGRSACDSGSDRTTMRT